MDNFSKAEGILREKYLSKESFYEMKPSCYLLAVYCEDYNMIKKAIEFYIMANKCSKALQLAKKYKLMFDHTKIKCDCSSE